MSESDYPKYFVPDAEDAGTRLDQFLTAKFSETSRSRMQQLISEGKVLVNGEVEKASYRVEGTEQITVTGQIVLPPLRAKAENITLDIVYEDDDLAVINKPAGMMVHAGAGATDDARNSGTLVNALLHHFQQLSEVSGELRPGIVHRLDKETSGLIIVAKRDEIHRKLATQFAKRQVKKTYLTLVHGHVKQDKGTITSSISRDSVRRTRMTTRRPGGREAISHYKVQKRIETKYGKFTMLEVRIDTGRTHQIRVHLSSLGHPVVGDALYGAPKEIKGKNSKTISLSRNFLHAAALVFQHPRTGDSIQLQRDLPEELKIFSAALDVP
ncbi:MAG TPA: RluA family pseudouridine synthase [Terriglobales bacterium]|nr:RluA family pseudouridine synthase [Terriglobales bacterium]